MKTPPPNTDHENDIWDAVQETVECYCREILADPLRGDYVKVRTAKKKLASDDRLPPMTDDQLQRYLGTALTDAAYTEKWGAETYKIYPEHLDP